MENCTIDKDVEDVRIGRRTTKSRIANNGKKSNKSNNSVITKIFTTLFTLGTIGIIVVLFLLYGPWSGFREWLVTTAMTTMTHQYFATWFYDEETINYVLDKNKIVEIDELTDVNAITTGKQENVVVYENEYERAILERDPKNNDYKIIEISEKKFDGYLVAVYEPSRVKTLVTANIGKSGQYVTTMAKNNDALIAINGGGFDDPNFNSTGGSPLGITVRDGVYMTTKTLDVPPSKFAALYAP